MKFGDEKSQNNDIFTKPTDQNTVYTSEYAGENEKGNFENYSSHSSYEDGPEDVERSN